MTATLSPKPLQRIGEVCSREDVSLRTMTRKLQIDTDTARRLRAPTSDMRLSDLHRVAEAIGVPAAELLSDVDANESQRLRGLLIRIAKIANSLLLRLTGSERLLIESMKEQIDAEIPTDALGDVESVCDPRRPLDEPSRLHDGPVRFGDLDCYLDQQMLLEGP